MEREKGEVFEMKNKILAIILIAALSLSMLAAIKFAHAQTPTIELRGPAVFNAAYGPPTMSSYFFNVEVWLVDVTDVMAWEAKIYWDPAVLQRHRIAFGPFFGEGTNNYTKGSMGGEYVLIGELKTDETTINGTGMVANLTMIMKYPGATHVWIYESLLLDHELNEIHHDTVDITVKTDHPAAHFTWWVTEPDGETPASPLPDHYLKDDCQSIQVYKIVWFDGSPSYDVCNLYWNETDETWWEDVGYPDIVEYVWTFGDGYQSNDIRIDPVLPPFALLSMVRLGDPDVGWPLILFNANETYYDADASKTYSPGDSICLDKNKDKMFNATKGDYVLYGPAVTEGSKLRAFTIYEKHTDGYLLPYGDVFHPPSANGNYTPMEYVYKDMQFMKDLGYCHVSVGSEVIDHVYSSYNFDGWEPVLRVYDSEGDYWQTDWRYGGSAPENIVPMYRDVGIPDIWPTLPPYDVAGWTDWWGWDTTDYVIPPPTDPWWDTVLTDYDCDAYGYPHGTTAREAGVYVTVSAANYGTVHDWVKVSLYAIKIEAAFTGLSFRGAGVTYEWLKTTGYVSPPTIEYIGSDTYKINKMAGAGFYFTFYWTPKVAAYYIFFATIDIIDAVSQDQNLDNNYFMLGTMVDALGSSSVPTTQNYAAYVCDILHRVETGGVYKVGPLDFNRFSACYGQIYTLPP